VEADLSNELLAEYAKRRGACTLVKGLRAASDFEKEFQMALINRRLNPNLETLFLPASEKYTYLSSSAVRELGRYGVDLSDWVPREIIEDVKMKWEAGGR
jgi:pantetheine-phosphate adenylyltransferase